MRRVAVVAALGLAGCGARTGLGVDEVEASPPDASFDAPADAPPDVVDAPPDVVDAPPDVVDAPPDVPEDVPPPICDDAGPTSIYVITSAGFLYRFDPPAASFDFIGTVACPTEYVPFSMAVRRNGTAYVNYHDGNVFEVSTATAACKQTAFAPGQLGWWTFGMAFVADTTTGDEHLFVTESTYQHPSAGLGMIDVQSFALDFVGPFSEYIGDAVELTGTGEGRLYAFGLLAGGGSTIADINSKTGAVFNQKPLTIGTLSSSFAFAQWGGDFYFFVSDAPGSTTTAYRYQPTSGALDPVATVPSDVVGAGVSTCAPH